MTEIIEEVKRVDKYTRYQATDGTIFDSASECEAYEKSALCVVKSKLKIVGDNWDAWSLMGGMDDNSIAAILLEVEDDYNNVLQFLYLDNPYYSTTEHGQERITAIKKDLRGALAEKDIVLFGINDGGDWYYINTRNNIIRNLKNLTNDSSRIDQCS